MHLFFQIKIKILKIMPMEKNCLQYINCNPVFKKERDRKSNFSPVASNVEFSLFLTILCPTQILNVSQHAKKLRGCAIKETHVTTSTTYPLSS